MISDDRMLGNQTRRDLLRRAGRAGLLVGAGASGLLGVPGVGPTGTLAQGTPAADRPTGVFNWGRPFKSRSRDPHAFFGLHEMVTIRQAMEPLVELDPAGQLRPVLAESWSVSADGLTWTFNLRRGVTFHDGTPFTAEAVKGAVERCKGNDKSGYAFVFANYADPPTTVVDEFTIEFKTVAPEAPVPYNLTVFYIPHPEAAANREMTYEKAVGTGPFRLVEFDFDRLYAYEANPNYWRPGFPTVQTVNLRPIVEQSSLTAATLAGEFDLVEGLSPDNVQELADDPNFELVPVSVWRVDFLIMNQAVPALADVNVRQAIARAVDREVIAQDINLGFGAPWATYPPQGLLGATDQLPANPYDPDEAKALLAQSGFADGFDVTISTFEAAAGSKGREIAQYVAQELEGLGIRATVEVGEETAIVGRYREGDYQMGLLQSVAVTGDPDRYYRERITGDLFKMGYANPAVNELIGQAAQTIDAARRQALYEEIQLKLWEEMPIVYLNQGQISFVQKTGVTGFEGMPSNVYSLTEIGLP